MRKLFLKSMLLLCALIVGSGTMWGAEKTLVYSVTSKTAVTLQNTSTGSFTGTVTFANSYTGENIDQMTSGQTMTLTLASFPYKVTKVSLNLHKNSSNGGGSVSINHNNNSIGSGTKTKADLTSSYANYDFTCSDSYTEGNLVVLLTSTQNSFWCNKFTITYDDTPAKTLSSISLSGTYPTTFTEKDDFSHTGMTVTANYDDNSTKDVTSSATFTGYNMNQVGNQTITVSYTEGNITKTATYGITINEGTKYSVTFHPETGTCGTSSLTETEYMGGVTLPEATCNKSGWVFAGWATSASSSTSTRPTLYKAGTTYKPASNVILHAVYSLDGLDGEKYVRATDVSEITSASSLAIVNANMILDSEFGDVSAPTETDNQIAQPDIKNRWTLTGNTSDGFTISNASSSSITIGVTSMPSSNANLISTSFNNLWYFSASTAEGKSNHFVIHNKTSNSAGKIGSIEYYSSAWKVYCLASSTFMSNASVACKIYVPVITLYNSNPTADIITPDLDFTTGTDQTLYLDGTTTYTDEASVTNVSQTITYTSSNPSVATVTSAGVVSAKGIGTTTITASVPIDLGVSSAKSVSYNVTVKSATSIASLKDIDNASGVAFTADLTDAVVTYVSGQYAYIQDASAAILINKSGHGLVAGKRINGAVSGTVKITNQIDQLTAIDISTATVTNDGVIPLAHVKTLAEIISAETAYDGMLVTVNNVSISKPSTTTTLKDGSKIEETEVSFTMYSPNSAASVNDQEKGNFTGFVSIYNGNTYRLNLYEQSQFNKTWNAPTNQTLSFATSSFSLDEETDAIGAFVAPVLSGAHTTVTYTKEDPNNVISTLNSSTGAVVLTGNCGTATVTATAAAEEITDAGVTTPYNEATKSYTITVNHRYEATFIINGESEVRRQATSGASIIVPTPATVGNYHFIGWSEDIVEPVDDKPSLTTPAATPTADATYYAVYAAAQVSGAGGSYELDYSDDSVEPNGYGNTVDVTATDGSSWVVKAYDNSGMQINSGKNSSITIPTCPGNISTIAVTCASGAKAVGLSASDYSGSGTITYLASGTDAASQTLTLSGQNVKSGYIVPKGGVAIITNIVVNYDAPITYSDYRTSLPEGVTIPVSLTASTWASYCFGADVTIPTSDLNLKVYRAKFNSSTNELTATPISGKIKAGEGVLLKTTTAGTTEYEFVTTTGASPLGDDNDLIGTIVATPTATLKGSEQYLMVLKKNDNKFVRYEGETFPANRACLAVTPANVNAPSAFRIVEEGQNATDIETIESADKAIKFIQNGQLYIKRDGVVYDAVGRLIRK